MRGLWLPVVCCLLAGAAHAQSIDLLKKYEEERKEKATALAISILIPGGGMVYSGNEGGGIAVFGASVASSWWLWNSIRDNDELAFPLLTTVLLRIADVALAFNWIDAHNSDLLNKLSIRVGAGSFGVKLSL